jgi:hypothetical protein
MLLLKGGHVIDPANGVDALADVAIAGDRVARVAPDLSPDDAERTVDCAGARVTPAWSTSTSTTTTAAAGSASTPTSTPSPPASRPRSTSARPATRTSRTSGPGSSTTRGSGAGCSRSSTSSRRLECLLTLRAGQVVYDREGLTMEDWREKEPSY